MFLFLMLIFYLIMIIIINYNAWELTRAFMMDSFFQPGGGRAKPKPSSTAALASKRSEEVNEKKKVPWVEK